jgi:hypothetical protein
MLAVALVFVWRSFFAMRIPIDPELMLQRRRVAEDDAVADETLAV